MGRRLASKTALVTGATSNIGRAIALAFAAEGAHVVVSGRSPERGGEVVDQIRRAGGRADFVAAELDGSPRASDDLAAAATRVLGGRVDILVNNAGIYPGSATAATDEATFDAVYALNVKAPFFLTAAIAPAMARRGDGAIINLGSWIARLGPSAEHRALDRRELGLARDDRARLLERRLRVLQAVAGEDADHARGALGAVLQAAPRPTPRSPARRRRPPTTASRR